MKKYKLLQPFFGFEAGTLFYLDNESYNNECYRTKDNKIKLFKTLVENNPDWFCPVADYKIGDIIKVFNDGCEYNTYDLCFNYYNFEKSKTRLINNTICKIIGNLFIHPHTNKIVYAIEDPKGNKFLVNDNGFLLANSEQIIQFYEQKGWVKGAKFKCTNRTDIICGLKQFSHTQELSVVGTHICPLISNCELIEESSFTKKYEDLGKLNGFCINWNSSISESECSSNSSFNRNVFKTEKQVRSALAFAQLSQLVASINDGWEPDWRNTNEDKYVIKRIEQNLTVSVTRSMFNSLCFKTIEARDFSFKHHYQLWKEYYELD